MTISRRQFLTNALALGAAGIGAGVLGACGGGTSRRSSLQPIEDDVTPEDGPLRVFNYADYLNPEVVADFEQKYGVKVEVTEFDDDLDMQVRLATRKEPIDVVQSMAPSSLGRLIDSGLVRPLNHSYLPNLANVVPGLQDPWYDAKSAYTVPYTFFGTGIAYRTDRIDPAQIESSGWSAFWTATDLAGQCTVLDSLRDVLALPLLRQDRTDLEASDKATLDTITNELSALSGATRVTASNKQYQTIPEGSISLAHSWSADMITAANGYLPAGTSADVLGFWHPPAERYVVQNDTMGIAGIAEHPVLAHLWLNHLLDNAVAEKNFAFVGYLPALSKLDATYLINGGYVPENLRNCVPTAEDIERGLTYRPLSAAGAALYGDVWSGFLHRL